MTLPFSLRQKVNIAVVLFTVMACTILINFLTEKSVTNMNGNIASIYNDRLVPATDLFEIAAHIHKKIRLIDSLEKENLAIEIGGKYQNRLKNYDISINALLQKYEHTYLVSEERVGLKSLKSNLLNVFFLQEKLLANQDASTFRALKGALYQGSTAVAQLSHIQLIVGKELIAKSQRSNQNAKIYSSAQFVMSLLIGILIFSILLTPSILQVKQNKFSLN
jgi:hypothetical protein